MTVNSNKTPADLVQLMLTAAWQVRESAHVIGGTRVGCSVVDEFGKIHVGCNVEHKFRSHDIHAETNAISSMIASGGRHIIAVAVVAERERFTPCGACMDWIMQFCKSDCPVYFQPAPGADLQSFTAEQLMPFYPR